MIRWIQNGRGLTGYPSTDVSRQATQTCSGTERVKLVAWTVQAVIQSRSRFEMDQWHCNSIVHVFEQLMRSSRAHGGSSTGCLSATRTSSRTVWPMSTQRKIEPTKLSMSVVTTPTTNGATSFWGGDVCLERSIVETFDRASMGEWFAWWVSHRWENVLPWVRQAGIHHGFTTGRKLWSNSRASKPQTRTHVEQWVESVQHANKLN